MSFDEHLAARVRDILHSEAGVTEKSMFGGLAFLINGNMGVSASGQGGLLLRVDPAETPTLSRKPHAEVAVMRGREMAGWLRVGAEGVRTKPQLEQWVRTSVAYARTLPKKKPSAR